MGEAEIESLGKTSSLLLTESPSSPVVPNQSLVCYLRLRLVGQHMICVSNADKWGCEGGKLFPLKPFLIVGKAILGALTETSNSLTDLLS